MRTNRSELYAQVGTNHVLKPPVRQEASTVHLVKSINAERQRVFQALTLAEYMEAWLTIPGVSPHCAFVTSGRNGFLIGCIAAEVGEIIIQASYRVCKRSRLLFDWKYNSNPSEGSSQVEIRLLGAFERTTVELVHFGLHESAVSWHRQLWQTSLAQLSAVLRS